MGVKGGVRGGVKGGVERYAAQVSHVISQQYERSPLSISSSPGWYLAQIPLSVCLVLLIYC